MAKIKEIRCIRTRANGEWLVVKVITDQPGLYGIDIDEDKARKLLNHEAMEARRYRVSEDRRADGTLVRP
jgi:mannonate dehydratase